MNRRFLTIFALLIPLCALPAAPARAVEGGDSALALQVCGVFLDGKLGDLFSPDFGYGVDMAYGITDHWAVFADALYSAHEQTSRDKYGTLHFTRLEFAIGPRVGQTWDHVDVYAGVAPVVQLMTYKARFPAGGGTDDDQLDTHGFGGAAEAGVDGFVSNDLTLGLAGRVSVVSTDMEFASGADMSNKIDTYTTYTGLLRLTFVF